MRRILSIATIVIVMFIAPMNVHASAKSDYELAKSWADSHCNGATIEKVITISKGGTKGRVKGSRWTVKYPKKVKKGKKVTVYMVEVNGEIEAMVCLGKVK